MEGKNPFFHTIYCFELKHFHCKYIPLILKPQFSVAKSGILGSQVRQNVLPFKNNGPSNAIYLEFPTLSENSFIGT